MLKNIPFYSSLLKRKLADGKKTTHIHVLVYGAIEIHDIGELGCIASNKTIGAEVGATPASTANSISDLSRAGWISVELDKVTNQRKKIVPLLNIVAPDGEIFHNLHSTMNPPSLGNEGPLHSTMNIDNNIENNKNITKTKDDEKESKYTNDDIRLTDSLFLTVANLFPTYTKLAERKPTTKDYIEFNKINRIDGNDYKLIEDVMVWVFTKYVPTGSFDWKEIIKSPKNLRKHFDSIRQQYEKSKNMSQNGRPLIPYVQVGGSARKRESVEDRRAPINSDGVKRFREMRDELINKKLS